MSLLNWHVGTNMARWHLKLKNWHAVGTLARGQMDHAGTHGTHLTPFLKETDGFLKYVKFLINYWGRKLQNCYLNTEEKD